MSCSKVTGNYKPTLVTLCNSNIPQLYKIATFYLLLLLHHKMQHEILGNIPNKLKNLFAADFMYHHT